MASRSRLLVWQRPVRGTEFHTSGTSRRCLHQPWKLVDKPNRHLPSARLQRRLLQLLLKQCQRNIRAATFGAISFRSRGVNGTSTHSCPCTNCNETRDCTTLQDPRDRRPINWHRASMHALQISHDERRLVAQYQKVAKVQSLTQSPLGSIPTKKRMPWTGGQTVAIEENDEYNSNLVPAHPANGK